MSVFCLTCGDNCCVHLQQNRRTMLTPREIDVIRAAVNPKFRNNKQIAEALGVTAGTLKVYTGRLYDKLGWKGGSMRELVLWAMAHREKLGIDMPTS